MNSASKFRTFFWDATGFQPYEWQVLSAVEGLPEVLSVPTGLGKTEGAVMAWAFRRLVDDDAREPLHLVYCLPMRALVSQTVRRLRSCFEALRAKQPAVDVRTHGDEADSAAEEPRPH